MGDLINKGAFGEAYINDSQAWISGKYALSPRPTPMSLSVPSMPVKDTAVAGYING
jgi:hypothetical protein